MVSQPGQAGWPADFPTSPNQPKDQSDQVGRPENELMLVLKDFFIFIFSSKDVQQGSESIWTHFDN